MSFMNTLSKTKAYFSNYITEGCQIRYRADTLGIFRFLFYTLFFLLGSYYFNTVLILKQPPEFFVPVGFLMLFDSNPFSFNVLFTLYIIESFFVILAAIGLFTQPSIIISTFLMLIRFTNTHSYQATFFLSIPLLMISFILCFARSGDAFSVDNLIGKKHIPSQTSFEYYWPFWLSRLFIGLVYLAAGAVKIRHRGTDWFLDDELQMHFLTAFRNQETDVFSFLTLDFFSKLKLNIIVGQYTILCRFLGGLTILLELFAWVGLVVKKLFWPIFLSLILFHLAIPFLMFVPPGFPLVMLSTWLPWDKMNRFFRKKQSEVATS